MLMWGMFLCKQARKQASKQANKQTNKQTDRHGEKNKQSCRCEGWASRKTKHATCTYHQCKVCSMLGWVECVQGALGKTIALGWNSLCRKSRTISPKDLAVFGASLEQDANYEIIDKKCTFKLCECSLGTRQGVDEEDVVAKDLFNQNLLFSIFPKTIHIDYVLEFWKLRVFVSPCNVPVPFPRNRGFRVD